MIDTERCLGGAEPCLENKSLFKVAGSINIGPLNLALNKNSHLWHEIEDRQKTPGSPHHDTKTIFLRWAASKSLDAVFNDLVAIDYSPISELPEAQPLIRFIMNAVGGAELGRVIIVNLQPGGKITPHIDEGAYADHYERFHLVLTSDIGNLFTVGRESVHMRPGQLWWFNHKRQHSVINDSSAPRIHMIVDCVAPQYRMERE